MSNKLVLSSYKSDLHLHSSISDGESTPKETLALCNKLGINTVSFTEHNYIGDRKLYENASKRHGVNIIPGIEISSVHKNKSYHILGYFKNFPSQKINDSLKPMVEGYERRAIRIIQKCQDNGIAINYKKIRKQYSEVYLSKYAIAEQVCKALKLQTVNDAFKLAKEKNNLFWTQDDFKFINTKSAIELIHKYKGIAVLAHPGSFFHYNESIDWKYQVSQFLNDLQEFVELGLDGIEVYYVSNMLISITTLSQIVKDNKLLVTGGSDWHGNNRTPYHPLGSGGLREEDLKKLIKRLEK